MTRRARRTSRPPRPRARALAAFLCASLCCLVAAQTRAAAAATLEDYRARVLRATEAMEGLHATFDETDDVNSREFIALERRTLEGVRGLLPAREKIEGAGVAPDVDNRWLHEELDLYAKIAADETNERDELLLRVSERLRALDTRLAEAANAAQVARDKEPRRVV
jgi:hypothetical protein